MNRCQHLNNLIKKMGNMAGGGNLPKAYQAVEYLEATGTQYIDTGVKAANELTFNAKFTTDHTPTGSGDNLALFGARTSASNRFFPIVLDWNMDFSYGYVSQYNRIQYQWYKNAMYDMTSFIGSNVITITRHGDYGWTYNTGTGGLFSGNVNLFMMAINSSYENRAVNIFIGKMYSGSIEQNSDKVRDFVPCYRRRDRKPGMFDAVTKQFFTNSGTGEFILGPET